LTRHLLLNQLQNYQSYTANISTIANVMEKIFSDRPKYGMSNIVNGLTYFTEEAIIAEYIFKRGF